MVERLNVFAFDRFVGTLSYDDHVNAFEFKYDSAYLSSPDVKDSSYYWARRFDRIASSEGVRRLHQEDFCQMMGYPAEEKYEFEGGPSLVRCLRFLRASRVGAAELATELSDEGHPSPIYARIGEVIHGQIAQVKGD